MSSKLRYAPESWKGGNGIRLGARHFLEDPAGAGSYYIVLPDKSCNWVRRLMTWLQESEPYAATKQPATVPHTREVLMVKTQGRSYITAVRSLPSQGGKTHPAAGGRFLRSSLNSSQSASRFLDCQGLSRQGLDRGLSRDSAVSQGWCPRQSPAQICRKLLIRASNCWRRGSRLLVGWGWGAARALPCFLHLLSSSPAMVITCLSSGSRWYRVREAGWLV